MKNSNTAFTINATDPGQQVSPLVCGVFFEEINYAERGGIHAE
jgi:hypothetical protein